MSRPAAQYPVLDSRFGNLQETMKAVQAHAQDLEIAFPYRDPFTRTSRTVAGKSRRSGHVCGSEASLKRFLSWCYRERLNLPPEGFDDLHVSYFLDYLRNECKLAPSTINSSLVNLRRFFREHHEKHGLRIPNPVRDNLIKVPRRLNPRSITEMEMQKLIQGIGRADSKARQLQLMVRLAYDGAARIGEVINLRFEDLQLSDSPARLACFEVNRKGGKIRRLYMSEETKHFLLLYLEERGIRREGQPVFPAQQGDRPIRPSRLSNLIRRHLQSMGIERKIYGTHIMRHSAAKHMIARNADPYVVADYMSHESICTTIGTYATAEDVEVARAFRECMPELSYGKVRKKLLELQPSVPALTRSRH